MLYARVHTLILTHAIIIIFIKISLNFKFLIKFIAKLPSIINIKISLNYKFLSVSYKFINLRK